LKKGIGLVLLFAAMPFGVEAIAWSYVGFCVISTIINIYPNKDILNYSYLEQFKDLGINFMAAAVVGGMVWGVSYIIHVNDILLLIIQTVLWLLLYVAISKVCKLDSYDYIKQTALKYIKSKRNEKV
jgi:hypothetical protein